MKLRNPSSPHQSRKVIMQVGYLVALCMQKQRKSNKVAGKKYTGAARVGARRSGVVEDCT